MPDFAKKISVERVNNRTRLYINGEEFPWFFTNGVGVDVTRDEAPAVTLTIPADTVTVEDTIDP